MLKRDTGSDLLRPKFSILNPQLTCTLPAYQTACGATDIMAHVFERYFTNTLDVEITDRLCEAVLLTMINETNAINKRICGINLYNEISGIIDNFDSLDVINKLNNVYKKLFNKKNLVVSVSGSTNARKALKDVVYGLNLSDIEYKEYEYNKELKPIKSSALTFPSDIVFDAFALKVDIDNDNIGKMLLLEHIINYDYIWPNVRVKGGAYGASIRCNLSKGYISGSSYRDPNITKTFDAFNNIYKYIENLNLTEEELNTYVIGVLGTLNQPGSINSDINKFDLKYLSHDDIEFKLKIEKDIINSSLDDLKSFAPIFKRIKDESLIMTIGNETLINELDIFEDLKKLI